MELELYREPVRVPLGDGELVIHPVGEGVFRFVWGDTAKVVAVEGDRAQARLIPAYLDRPVLLMFSPPLDLAPRGQAKVFATLPMGLEVVLEENGLAVPVFEISPPGLKRAWFGDMESGVLVYAVQAEPVETFQEAPGGLFTVLLPLELRNEDRSPHEISQVLVDTPQLSIFETPEGHRVAEVVKVAVDEERMEVRYTDQPPRPNLREIRKGEESAELLGLNRLARRTFSRWKRLLRPFDAFGN